MPINLSQYCWLVGIFNNRNFSVQSKVSHFIYLSDNNNNNNNNTEIGCLILLNKIGLVLLLLTLMFAFKGNNSKYKKTIFVWVLSPTLVSFNLLHWLFILRRDAELNPGPKRNAAETLSICHWNLNSICALHFAKLHLLRAYVSVHKFNIICLSKTYYDSSIDDDII